MARFAVCPLAVREAVLLGGHRDRDARRGPAHPYSHQLAFFPKLELWACLNCGFYAESLARKLGKPCSNKRSRRGQNNLKALEEGRHPEPAANRPSASDRPLWPVRPTRPSEEPAASSHE